MLRRFTAGALCALCLTACSTLPDSTRDPHDRFEAYNRFMFKTNSAIDDHALLPITRAYVKVVAPQVRRGVSRFFNNLSYPRTLVNDALQGKLRAAGSDTVRLAVNTVLGLGFFDPATRLGLEAHSEDFGQTLGKWGVPAGPYLMLPVLGPSTLRDSFGRVPDELATGRYYIQDTALKYSLAALDGVDARASLLEANAVLDQSFDRYTFVRNAWLKRREYLVRDGNVPDETLEEPADIDAAPDAPPNLPPATP
jgi:phospholipid-binding lipoprotein MlaA